jgi:hypothetical protein
MFTSGLGNADDERRSLTAAGSPSSNDLAAAGDPPRRREAAGCPGAERPEPDRENNERGYVSIINQTAYVRDFEVEVAQAAFIADPKVDVIQDGIVLDVKPTVSADRKPHHPEPAADGRRAVRPIPTFSTSLAGSTLPVTLQLPTSRSAPSATTVEVPDGGTVLIGGLRQVLTKERRAEVPILGKPAAPLLPVQAGGRGRRELVADGAGARVDHRRPRSHGRALSPPDLANRDRSTHGRGRPRAGRAHVRSARSRARRPGSSPSSPQLSLRLDSHRLGHGHDVSRPLDAIFFDIDDTLFSTSVFADKARRAAVDAMIAAGLRADARGLLPRTDEVVAEFSSNYGAHFDKVVHRLAREREHGLNRADPRRVGRRRLPRDEVARAEGLRRRLRGPALALRATRTGARHHLGRHHDQAGREGHPPAVYEFLTPNAIFFTEQVGISKPNPKLYRRVLQR